MVARNSSRVVPVNVTSVPTTDEIVTLYTEAGGRITTECSIGVDPLAGNAFLMRRRDEEFLQSNPSFTETFNNVVNGNGLFLKQAINNFILITRSLS